MLLIHAAIHTMQGGDLADGYIKIQGSVIEKIGSMSGSLPQDEETVDLNGAHVYPGFIDAHTHLGMWEDGLGFEGDDGNEDTDPATPQLRAIDAINPLDRCFEEALDAGVTTVVTGPGSANAIGGQLAAVKTYGRCIDDMVVKEPVAMKMALGENPKSVYHGKNLSPSTRMATAAIIREHLFKAQRYAADLQSAKDDPDLDPPEYDMKSEALLPVLDGSLPVHFHAHRADDIFTALRIAKEFNLRCVIVHGTEGHQIADVLARANVPVLAGPILCDRSKPELRSLTPANPGILAASGVPTALVTDHPVIPVQYLSLCAALAVREGMEEQNALAAVTIRAAEICGIDGRVGSIAPGKDADLAVFRSNPLTLTEKPVMVFCGGKRVR